MKILVISNLYPPNSRGGAEMIARDFAEEASRQGHELVSLSTLTCNESQCEIVEECVNGVSVRKYAPNLPYHLLDDIDQSLSARIIWHVKDLIGSRSTSSKIHDVIKSVAPELIVTFNLRGMEIGSVVRVIRRSKVTWIHELHDVQLLVPSGLQWYGKEARVGLRWLWQSSLVRAVYGFVTRSIMGSPDTVVSPSQFMIDAHKNAGLFNRSQFSVLINPVKVDLDKRTRQESIGVIKLLYVGQLEEHKGVSYMIEALYHVGEHKVSLDVVGNGSQQDELINKSLNIPDSVEVTFHGRVAHNKVFEFMSQASVLVLPSIVVENCPGVILEARAVGLPVIASNVGGISELIPSPGLFEPADARAITERIHDVALGEVESIPGNGLLSVSDYVKKLLTL